MSWLPFFFSFVIALLLVSFFMWVKWGMVVGLFLLLTLVPFLIFEVVKMPDRRPFAFVLFLFSEAMLFVSLFVVTLWLEDETVKSISTWSGIPLVGCLLLISSSFAVTAYHNLFEPGGYGYCFLLLSVVFGFCFVCLQLVEMWECGCDITFCAYYSGAFCTVGLHFFHVLLGLFILGYLVFKESFTSFYYITLSVWYWHFVDYIWLLVFVVVYLV